VDGPKRRNPNIELFERRDALRTLHALNVADAGKEKHPRIEAQSVDDFDQAIIRRLRP
jgi:hypothetical protein